jgi:hypothetical protein
MNEGAETLEERTIEGKREQREKGERREKRTRQGKRESIRKTEGGKKIFKKIYRK